MKLSAAIAFLAVAAPSAEDKPFEIMSLRSASPIYFDQVSASHSNTFINSKTQDAVCEVRDKSKAPTRATFYIKDEILYLYTSKGPVHKAFIDRSGMGQGKLGYLSGNGPLPPRFEDKGWKVDKTGNLSFDGKGLIACPGADEGSWTFWVDTNAHNPGGNTGCLGFSARTIQSEKPVRCEYSQ